MTATHPTDTRHTAARRALDAAERELQSIPTGQIRTDILAAHSAKAQVYVTAAIAHAILELVDTIRDGRPTPQEQP
jgi:hypothetical protein